MSELPTVLILTPVKNAEGYADSYFQGIDNLDYPKEKISIGVLEGDSDDNTFSLFEHHLKKLKNDYLKVNIWKKDFKFKFPPGIHRWAAPLQIPRRTVLAKARNHLLFRALNDEQWVMWLDVDVVEYPADILQTLFATGKKILHPHCVFDFGGHTFDCNAWKDKGKVHMDQLRGGTDLVRLDTVGGTLLLIDADIHRDGLIFPAYPYGRANPFVRDEMLGEYETEGLGIMANDMGHQCWGLPNLEIRHAKK